jgi:hypothetical protein
MRRSIRWAVGLVLGVILLYVCDALWVRFRIATRRDAKGSVQVRVLLAVPQKGGRTEFIPGNTETQVCVYSMFPQVGLPPCWYAQRHTRKEVDF